MLKFDLPQHDSRYTVWIELQTYDELHKEMQGQAWTLDQVMRERGETVRIFSAYDTQTVTHSVTYADLVAAFPYIDPEEVYPIIHFH